MTKGKAPSTPKRLGRPSPSTSAAALPVKTRMTGNDGATWEVRTTLKGVHRWQRVHGKSERPQKVGKEAGKVRKPTGVPGLPGVPGVSGCMLMALLPIALDDRLGQRARVKGRLRPTPIPDAARALVRRLINRDAFNFGGISFEHGVPMKRSWKDKLVGALGVKSSETPDTTSANVSGGKLAAYELVEKENGHWFVRLSWTVRGASASEIDLDGVRTHLDGHFNRGLRAPSGLIYGWGLRAEDYRFGPPIACSRDDEERCRVIKMSEIQKVTDNESVDMQFSLNLSVSGGLITAKPHL